MSTEIKQQWFSWPYELPLHNEFRKCEEYQWLHDETRNREMHVELRSRALSTLKTKLTAESQSNAAVLMMGGTSADFELYDTDVDKTEFRQESYFQYLFQIVEPDCFGALDLVRGEALLFVPEISDDSQRWNGTRRPLEYYTQRYGVTSTHLTKDLHQVLQSRGIKLLHTLHGTNLDSGNTTRTVPTFPEISSYSLDSTQLYPILTELRVIKTKKEQDVMRVGTLVASQAHVYVMRHIKPGMTELQLEALFKSWVHYHGGTRHCAYTCICGSGAHGSVLHYGHAGRPNDRILQNGDTVVLDMGGEFQGYATDLTRSFAISGKFTADQRAIHTAVYEAQQAVFNAMKPGVSWPEMHQLSEHVIIQHLLKIGILKGTPEECKKAHMGSVFMPHGLGHMLGMDVHDVGGYLPGTSREPVPGLCWLRCGRKLESGMVITVEPGIYFNDPWLDKALSNPAQAQYIDTTVLQRFRGTGGCRLEDDVLVTDTGIENFSIMPTSVDEIEAVMQQAHLKN